MICNLNIDQLILLKDVNDATNDITTVTEKTAEDYSCDIEMLSALVLQNENVVSVKAFETSNARVFSVLTVPIFLKSERDALVKSLEDILSQGKQAYVSLDGDVYRRIKPDMTDEQKRSLLDTVISRKNNN